MMVFHRNCYYTYKYKALQWKLENLIESSKQSYYKRVSGKLSSISTSSECYWPLLKRVLNDKKVLVNPPCFIIITLSLILKKKAKSLHL